MRSQHAGKESKRNRRLESVAGYVPPPTPRSVLGDEDEKEIMKVVPNRADRRKKKGGRS